MSAEEAEDMLASMNAPTEFGDRPGVVVDENETESQLQKSMRGLELISARPVLVSAPATLSPLSVMTKPLAMIKPTTTPPSHLPSPKATPSPTISISSSTNDTHIATTRANTLDNSPDEQLQFQQAAEQLRAAERASERWEIQNTVERTVEPQDDLHQLRSNDYQKSKHIYGASPEAFAQRLVTFSESNSQHAVLPEDDPEAFEMFMQWVTGGRVHEIDHQVLCGKLNDPNTRIIFKNGQIDITPRYRPHKSFLPRKQHKEYLGRPDPPKDLSNTRGPYTRDYDIHPTVDLGAAISLHVFASKYGAYELVDYIMTNIGHNYFFSDGDKLSGLDSETYQWALDNTFADDKILRFVKQERKRYAGFGTTICAWHMHKHREGRNKGGKCVDMGKRFTGEREEIELVRKRRAYDEDEEDQDRREKRRR